jgi:hypothetical protein
VTTGRGVLAAIVLAALAAGCGATRVNREVAPSAADCPDGVLFQASANAPGGDVLRSAQRVLSRRTIHSQGTIYRLTPKWAPIDFVARVSAVESRRNVGYNRLIPGSLAIERAGSAQCGAHKAVASWAVHYGMPASVIANTGVYAFFVKTRSGWRFWGQWCGAGESAAWRRKNCIF